MTVVLSNKDGGILWEKWLVLPTTKSPVLFLNTPVFQYTEVLSAYFPLTHSEYKKNQGLITLFIFTTLAWMFLSKAEFFSTVSGSEE